MILLLRQRVFENPSGNHAGYSDGDVVLKDHFGGYAVITASLQGVSFPGG
jgi:hypothetical protein